MDHNSHVIARLTACTQSILDRFSRQDIISFIKYGDNNAIDPQGNFDRSTVRDALSIIANLYGIEDRRPSFIYRKFA